MFKARENIEYRNIGKHISSLTFPPHVNDFQYLNESLDESFLSTTTCDYLSSEIFSEPDYV